MSSISRWSAESNNIEANFGNSVSSAGDINGDGYSDVIVGASGYENGQINEGAVFIYYSSASGLPATASLIIEGNQNNTYFGNSVSSAGDVNGDGYSDVIIGAIYYDNGQTNEGAAFVFHGSASGLSTTANWIAEGNQIEANFGYSVSSAGDINGDGYSDVIIGAVNYENGQTDEGAAFVFHGSASGLSATANWIAEGNQIDENFGKSVSSAGDVNGDGYSDVIIGAFLYENGQTLEGAAFEYHGSVTGLSSTANWIAEGNQAYKYLGSTVSFAGDVNGDGFSDVLVGATGSTESSGGVFAYYGSITGLSAISNWAISQTLFPNYIYWRSTTAGDVNGDGYSDVILGNPDSDFNIEDEGSALIYHGSSTGLELSPKWKHLSNIWLGYFGFSVSTAGDVNGDGYSDVIIGMTGYSSPQLSEGAAFVYFGGINDLNSMKSSVNQFKYGTSNVVSSDGNTGTTSSVRLQHFAKSPFGKGTGRIVYDIQPNGIPFAGSDISKSTSYNSTPPSYTSLGLTGTNIFQDMTGFNSDKKYKWRARAQYKMTNFPFQKYGPWRYYNNYSAKNQGGFRPSDGSTIKQLNLTMLIQGFYNSSTNLMIQDTATVYLRNSASPYLIVDSAKAYLSNTGTGTLSFSNAANGVNYYLQLKHRNSIETWSKTAQIFSSGSLTYNFTTAVTQAFGNNLILADSSPVRYAVFNGDVNQDGTVDLNDVVQTYNAANVFTSGYTVTDLTGDNLADLNDVILAYNNSAGFVAVVKP